MRVLVIDDHQESADALAAVASELSHSVTVAYDGQTALQITETQSFDVVFFDVGLPDVDGRELCRLMRETGASRDACVIAVTGRTDLRGDDFASFDGYLHKPISSAALKRALEMWETAIPDALADPLIAAPAAGQSPPLAT